jgi:hypothetical protein
MSDLESRADDYEQRLAAAGGDKGVLSSLVFTARDKKTIKWLVISIIFDLVLSIGLGIVSVIALHNSAAIQKQTRLTCLQVNKDSAAHNAFVQTLIDNTPGSPLTDAVKRQRIKDYEALIIKIPECPK